VKVKSASLAPAISVEGPRRVYTWTRSNLENTTAGKTDSAQLATHGKQPAPDIQLSSFQTWEEVGRWYDGLQRERIAPTPQIREKAAELTRNASDVSAKLLAIYNYVSTDFRYIGVSLGIGRYQPHFAAEVLSNQYGDCKDKHTLLASLLAAAGIQAYPALINSSHVIDLDVPSPGQFDHVITVVPRGKDTAWLDTTTEVAPFGYLLLPLRGKPALVIPSDRPANFQQTPEDPPFPSSWIFRSDAKLDDSGTLKGKVEQTIRGDLEVSLRAAFRSMPRSQWKDLIQKVSYATGFAGDVTDVTASLPESTEAPLHFAYTYTRNDYPDWKERRILLPAPGFVPPPNEEGGKLPLFVWLGAPGEIQFESRVELPKGYSPDLPKKKDIRQDSIEYHSTYALEDNVLVGHYRVLTKAREVSGEAVRDYKVFAEKVHEDREQFITLSSGAPETAEQAVLQMRQRVWELAESSDPQALQAEREARSAVQQGSIQGGIDGLKKAVTQDPKFTRAWILLGELYLGSMQKDTAVDAFRKAVDSDPQQAVSYKMLAFALSSLGRSDDAIRVWENLAKVEPEDHDAAMNLGLLLGGEKRYREAVPYLESAVKFYPQRAAPLLALGTAYLQNGEDDKALASFDHVLQIQPGADAKNSVAYELALSNKRLDDGLRYAQEAVREEEDASRKVELSKLAVDDLRHTLTLGAYWDTLGWVHYRLGNLKLAAGYLYAAWTVQQIPVVGFHLAQVYEKQQRIQDAAHMYRLVVNQQVQGAGEQSQAVAESRQRLEHLKVPASSSRIAPFPGNLAGAESSQDRTISLPKLVSEHASAEFFLLFAPGPKVDDTKFITGSDHLRSAGKALSQAHFKVAFPENSSGRLVRRGILACYPITGCTFVLLPAETVRSVE
jgi:Tfp pilus assembly protein PilF